MTLERAVRVDAELKRRECERARHASCGWYEITNSDELESLADRFFNFFFPASAHCLPVPSVTWDVSQATYDASRQEQQNLIEDLHRKCLRAIRKCDPNAVWFALENIHHPWYRMDLSETPEHVEDWPIVLLPYADPCYLIAQNCSCGFIADLDRTISVFGNELLIQLRDQSPLVFCTMVHSTSDESPPSSHGQNQPMNRRIERRRNIRWSRETQS